MGDAGADRPRGAIALACALLFVTLSVAHALVWEHQHDEGISFDVAIAHMELTPGQEPVPITTLYDVLDGGPEHGPRQVLDALRDPGRMNHPPLFYLGLNGWARLVGTHRLALRLPQILLGLVSLLALGRLASRVAGGRGAGEWAMLLLAVSPWFSALTVFLRPYALPFCAGLCATLAVLALADGRSRGRARVAFVLCSLVGLLSVYHYLFVLAAHGAWLAWRALRTPPGERGRELRGLALMGGALLLGFAPWLPSFVAHLQVTQADHYYWKDPGAFAHMTSLAPRLLQRFALAEVRLDPAGPALLWVLTLLAVVTAPMVLLAFLPRGRADLDGPARQAWLFAALIPALIAAADVAREAKTLFITKYNFGWFPWLALLLVRGIQRARWAAFRPVLLAAWPLLLLTGNVLNLQERARTPSPEEALAAGVSAHDRPGHVLVLSSVLRRYATQQVLALREAGVSEVRVVHAPADGLAARGDLLQDPSITRLTLLASDAEVGGGESLEHRRAHTWTAEQTGPFLATAREDGWSVRSGRPAGDPHLWDGPEPALTLPEPIRAKTFHPRN
jgi:hypothetical protein